MSKAKDHRLKITGAVGSHSVSMEEALTAV